MAYNSLASWLKAAIFICSYFFLLLFYFFAFPAMHIFTKIITSANNQKKLTNQAVLNIISKHLNNAYVLKKNERGAPHLVGASPKNEITLAEKKYISISHTPINIGSNVMESPIFLALVIANRTVGVDCQWVPNSTQKLPRHVALASRYFSPKENEAILTTSSETRRQEIFFQTFTLKEALIKASGIPLLTGMKTCTQSLNLQWQWQYFSTQQNKQGYVAVTVLWKNSLKKEKATKNKKNLPNNFYEENYNKNWKQELACVLKWQHKD